MHVTCAKQKATLTHMEKRWPRLACISVKSDPGLYCLNGDSFDTVGSSGKN